jgi:DNA (cytosine-5)-methyltransferase 1
MGTSYVSVTDLFCGAGGQSEGITRAGGEVVVALNHWARAIQTHNANFPQTYHEKVDISQANPRRYPSSTLLCASPECTNHTGAKGKARVLQMEGGLWNQEIDDAATRSRATMWDVPRFAEIHHYEAIIIENVVEAAKWVMWDAWLHAMASLGYTWKCLYFNSMHFHPVPQSRDRLYVVFWKKGNAAPDLSFTPSAYCGPCGRDVAAIQSWKGRHWGKYRAQYVYRCPVCARIVEPYYYCAANAIDWSLTAERIGDRKRPLAANTRSRIASGLEKMLQPRQVGNPAYIFTPETVRAMGENYRTFVVTVGHSGPENESRQRLLTAPLPVQATTPAAGIVQAPLLIPLSYGGDDRARLVDGVMPAQTARQDLALAIAQPFLVKYYGSEVTGYPVTDGVGSMTSHDHHGLVEPLGNLDVDDCTFRMIGPGEVKRAMAFPEKYIITGPKREQVHQLGNAVTPPVLEWIGKRVLATL